jgi:hypothetical protein
MGNGDVRQEDRFFEQERKIMCILKPLDRVVNNLDRAMKKQGRVPTDRDF